MTLGIGEILDFVRNAEFQRTLNTAVLENRLFPPSGERVGETYSVESDRNG
jgi:hypothetical protein